MNRKAEDLFTYARRDLAAAQCLAAQGQDFSHQICFLSQQAAEKGLKSVLAALKISIPRTHNLGLLVQLIPKGLHCAELGDLKQLTDWAVASRYPTPNVPPPSKKDADSALRQAGTILALVEQDFEYMQQNKANERMITDMKSINYLEQYMNQKKTQITSTRESSFDLDY